MREPAELEGEEELADELAAVGIRRPDRRSDRLAGQDHHVPDLLEQTLGGQERPVGYGSDHLSSEGPPWASAPQTGARRLAIPAGDYVMERPTATQNRRSASRRRYPRKSRLEPAPGYRAWYVARALGERPYQAPVPRPQTARHGAPGRALAGSGDRLLWRHPPGRERALRQLPGRGHHAEVPDPAAARPDHQPDLRGREHRRQGVPDLADHDLHGLETRTRRRPDRRPDRHDLDHEDLPIEQGSFSVRSDQPGLAIPYRPVWILENGYPEATRRAEAASAARRRRRPTPSRSARSTRRPDQEHRLEGDRRCRAGTYTVHYQLAAGLEGKAKAVTDDGSIPEGEFVVRISTAPPQTRVNDSGQVVPIKPSDIIGQAGNAGQKSEPGGSGPRRAPSGPPQPRPWRSRRWPRSSAPPSGGRTGPPHRAGPRSRSRARRGPVSAPESRSRPPARSRR